MQITALAVTYMCIFGMILLPRVYQRAIDDTFATRLWIQASGQPCPNPPPTMRCAWKVQARKEGSWQDCAGSELPSGADLPSHRWFKIIPKCTLAAGIPLLLPPQVVYR